MIDTLRSATAFATLALAACAAPATETASTLDDSYDFGSCGLPFQGPHATAPVRSVYVPMRDEVRIALDVVLPEDLPQGERVPTILTVTRYWRSWQGDGTNDLQRFRAEHATKN